MKRKTVNEFKLEIPSLSENESFARASVSSFIARLDPTLEELADIRTVISEAVTNCVVHGYAGTGGKIYITVRCYEGRLLCFRIKDQGRGIENIELAMTPLYTSDPSGERGGMGFTIMKSFTDRMTVRSSAGSGTTVTMYKQLAD